MAELEQVQFTWKPNPGPQAVFLSLPDSILEGFYGGAAGPGKSEALTMYPIVRKFYEIPTFHGIILRRTFRQLEGSLILRAQQYYPLVGGKYNDQKKRFTFPSGAIIDFGHAEHEKDITQYDTAEYQYIAFDELTHFTEFQYRYMISRCRTRDTRLPAIMRSASNPGNIGHGWVRKRFVEPARNGGKILLDEKGNKRIFIPGHIKDNPVLLKADPEYVRRLELLPESERRAKLEGDWWTFTGQVFEEFRSERFGDEPERALHVIPSYPIPDWVPRILSIDWGYTAPVAAYWSAIYPNGKIVTYREYVEAKKKISVWTADIIRLSQGEQIDAITLDPSAWQNRGHEKTIAEQVNTEFKLAGMVQAEKADNDRISGKMLIHEYLRWEAKPPKVIPVGGFDQDVHDWIYRNRGLEASNNYRNAFIEEKEDLSLLPRWQITDNCVELIKTIPLCVYDEKHPEDVAEFTGDDPYDSIRYGLKLADRFILTGANRQNKILKNAQIYADFEKDNDQFRLYRRLEMSEKQNNITNAHPATFGVRPRMRSRRRWM